ncbi:isoprenylcysteine carboxylmethyltransferase family protein [Paenarthrobacter sp. NPDC089322]|uniref:methyltransferase family protein n=1 Tax=Paenarthrobacter sp. NPDC089322 TaxID=3155065 RepID=UPI00342B3659
MVHGMGAVRRTALALKQEAGRIPLPPGQVLGLVIDAVLQRRYPTPPLPARGLRRALGTCIAVTGAGITVWAVVERRRHTTGSFVLGHPEELVTTGPYAASRHPMYLGWWLIHSGVALSGGSASALATLPAGILVEHMGALWEEKVLLKEFGQSYADYSARVPRYFGIR